MVESDIVTSVQAGDDDLLIRRSRLDYVQHSLGNQLVPIGVTCPSSIQSSPSS